MVLAAGLALVLGILYRNFDGQMRDELVKEAAYLEYGVEQQGADYLKNIKDKSARITYIAQDGTVLLTMRQMLLRWKTIGTEMNFRRLRSMVQENLRDIQILFPRKQSTTLCA